MLLPKKNILCLFLLTVLALTTRAEAGLYGFSQTSRQSQIQRSNALPRRILNYRKEMRNLITALSRYGKSRNPDFQILTHEGQYLLDKSLWEYHQENYNWIRNSNELVNDESFLSRDVPEIEEEEKQPFIDQYTEIIDGIVVNNHYCSNTPVDSQIKNKDISLFSIEYCSNENALDNAIAQSFADNVAIYPFVHLDQAFRKIHNQLIINESADSISKVAEAKNISFLINDEPFNSLYHMIDDIRSSNYDIIVINPIFQEKHPFTSEEINSLKFKKNGARRLVLALYNISEISPSDYLWSKQWNKKHPDWIVAPSRVSENSYITKYWTPEWRRLTGRYFKSIVDTGYDGVFFTGLENHNYFEHNTPLE